MGAVFNSAPAPTPAYTRKAAIPGDAVKMTPATDLDPPVVNSNEFEDPVPMPGPVNTAGAEDSPFITPDGQEFYFFFTPDVRVPVEKQILDHVTGIWSTHRVAENWTEPSRVLLGSTQSLDGCEDVRGNTMWFCSVRAGNYRSVDIYNATRVDGQWTDVQNAGAQLNVDYAIGEFTFSPDGATLYYAKDGGIWALDRTPSGWTNPHALPSLSVTANENQPFVTPNGTELWFTGWSLRGDPGPSCFRSIWIGTGWGAPVEIVSRFAGEPTLDAHGNVYLVHHFFTANGTMIEADIYVAYRRGISVTASQAPVPPDLARLLASVHPAIANVAPARRPS